MTSEPYGGFVGSVSVSIEPADQPDMQRLLDLSDAVAAQLYPGAFRQPLNAATLQSPDVTLFLSPAMKRAMLLVVSPCSTRGI